MCAPRATIPPPMPPIKIDLKRKYALQSLDILKSKGFGDNYEIAVVLEYIMEKLK